MTLGKDVKAEEAPPAEDASGQVMQVGTEHEYSINDADLNPLPINDLLIKTLTGEFYIEAPFGGIALSKELQKHVLEMRTLGPHKDLSILETEMVQGMRSVDTALGGKYRFLGLGMHPLLHLDKTCFWDHDEREYFDEFHRVFGLQKHGWLNIQALQINFPYVSETDFVIKFNRVRSLIPYLVAVTAASPFVEGERTGKVDNRVIFYKENQRKIPLICNDMIPERLTCIEDYHGIQERIYKELRKEGAELLCNEWVNSRGVIARFSRKCLEIKAMDEQECVRSDMGVTAFVRALLRVKELPLEEDRDALLEMNARATEKGTSALRPELQRLYDIALENAHKDDRQYLPLVKRRIDEGCLGELMLRMGTDRKAILGTLDMMAKSLKDNAPFFGSA
jgi:hypothetical protein